MDAPALLPSYKAKGLLEVGAAAEPYHSDSFRTRGLDIFLLIVGRRLSGSGALSMRP